ncbi:unnamed protein product [Pedinophyceae sp. YPF-701]|nr:unnamed protein product [Pedinophyceae sp. YPF-701]CAG9462122.1 unnamed protein product [Pedinophyceae sp. YPF-701]
MTAGGAGEAGPSSAPTARGARTAGPPEDPALFVRSLAEPDHHRPTVPDDFTAYKLQVSGACTDDEGLIRLVSLGAQKFITDILDDAFQHGRRKTQIEPPAAKRRKDADGTATANVLTTDDLSKALKDRGIDLGQPPYLLQNDLMVRPRGGSAFASKY